MGAHEAPARRPVTLGPPGVWARLVAFGRRWPDAYRHAHTLALYLLPLELLTGAILYFPRLHTALIPLLPAVLAVHVWAGVVFGLLLLVPLVVPLGRRLAATVDWRATVWLVGALSLTGLGLWLGAVPAVLRSGAFTAHGVLSIGLLAWVLYHGLVRFETALRGGDPDRTAERHGVLRRRTVLRELARALGSTFAATAVVGWVSTILASVRAQGTDGGSSGLVAGDGATATAASGRSRPLPGFQIYTVTSGFPGQAYEPSTFRLTVTGAVAQELSLSLDDLLQLPQVTETKSFHCVTGWVVPKVVWTGVRLADILAKAQPQPVAGWISFDSFDGVYTDSLSLDQAQADGVLLAHHADGAPLAPEQGAPLRLVVPDMYGYKSVKWVGRLRLVGSRELGYWEQRGYGPDAYLGTINGWPAGQGIFGLFQ